MGERGKCLYTLKNTSKSRRSAQNTKKSISNSNNEPNFTLHEISGLGGFLGGVIVSSIGHDIRKNRHGSHHGNRGSVEISYGRNYGSGHHNKGHYEYRTIKRWVPGYWEYRDRFCDTPIKVWVEGRYIYHKEKVWVRDYGRHGGYYSQHHTYNKRSSRHGR